MRCRGICPISHNAPHPAHPWLCVPQPAHLPSTIPQEPHGRTGPPQSVGVGAPHLRAREAPARAPHLQTPSQAPAYPTNLCLPRLSPCEWGTLMQCDLTATEQEVQPSRVTLPTAVAKALSLSWGTQASPLGKVPGSLSPPGFLSISCGLCLPPPQLLRRLEVVGCLARTCQKTRVSGRLSSTSQVFKLLCGGVEAAGGLET